MFFYELHEGDNEVYSDVLVVSESEWEPDEFFELVQTIRRRLQNVYVHDTLSQAIAVELEREHGFIFVSDDRLMASVNVGNEEEENFLAKLEVDLVDPDDDDDDDDDGDDDGGADYRAIIADLDPDLRLN
jgi:superfamily I DNA and RNA helicase